MRNCHFLDSTKKQDRVELLTFDSVIASVVDAIWSRVCLVYLDRMKMLRAERFQRQRQL